MEFISKSIFLARLLAYAVLLLAPPVSSSAQSNKSNPGLPPGDYIYDPNTNSYLPFGGDPNKKRTGFVEDGYSGRSAGQIEIGGLDGSFGQDCENSSGLAKNARQLGQMGQFIKTAIIGKDSRCPLKYGPGATDTDRALYGTGKVADLDSTCNSKSKNRCAGSGHLVGDTTDIVVTSAHVFQYGDNNELMTDPRKGFVFIVRVWSPRTNEYVFKRYKVKDYEFGTTNPDRYPDLDYAFLRLEEEVGKDVDGLPVPKEYQIKPLPFKLTDESKVPKSAMTAGYNTETNDFSKNCAPFSLTTMPSDHPYLVGTINVNPGKFWLHNGDTIPGSSGQAVALRDENGQPYFAAVHRGWIKNNRPESGGEQAAPPRRNAPSPPAKSGSGGINFAVKAESFYGAFMRFVNRGAP
ncbi:MAG: hypothetical protein IPL83_00930 [Bdellovibrionales bacterium]|nr:hypothetical protein [Bdellovibrionales bacterium]